MEIDPEKLTNILAAGDAMLRELGHHGLSPHDDDECQSGATMDWWQRATAWVRPLYVDGPGETELKVDTFSNGQESYVRITHLPTGIVAGGPSQWDARKALGKRLASLARP